MVHEVQEINPPGFSNDQANEHYESSEVIREALRDRRIKQLARQQKILDIRRSWEEGIQSGPGRFANVAELLQEVERRYQTDHAREDTGGWRASS